MQNSKLKIGFVADPIERFNPLHETTFFLMAEASARGHQVEAFEPRHLFTKASRVYALSQCLIVKKSNGRFVWRVQGGRRVLPIEKLDCLFLRKDPPVNEAFITHLHLLSLAEGRLLMVNSPSGILKANEKLCPLIFSGLSPPTVVSADLGTLTQAVSDFKIGVLKPLYGAGGRGVLLLKAKDPNLKSLLEISTQEFTQPVMVQKFIPSEGDKRILLLAGQPLGCFLRVPSSQDFRANLHSGGQKKFTRLTKRDHEIMATLKLKLLSLGLHFVGLDVLGDWVTEINSTSPMGLGEINHFENSHCEKTVIDWVENSLF